MRQISKNLIENIKSHWSDEINLISKLVISRLVENDKDFLNEVDVEDRIFILGLNLAEYKEEMWGVHFDLKAD